MLRLPTLRKTTVAEIVNSQGNAYKRTGADTIRLAPPQPAPAQPAGVQRLQEEMAANTQRQEAIRAELAQLEAEYAAAALRWDVEGELAAREAMNKASEQRRALQFELNDLADDATRLQARTAAAQAAYRRAEHDADLVNLDRLCDEYAPILAEYKRAALHLVELADALHRRRYALGSLRNRVVQYADANGLDKPGRNVSRETALPLFSETWLHGADGSVKAARLAMGLQDDTD